MFWRKKAANDDQCPSVDDLNAFVEWQLKHGKDFDELRTVSQSSNSRFVKVQSQNILAKLESLPDEASLTAEIIADCEDYTNNYYELVESAGSMQNLPTHLHTKAFPLMVEIKVLMHVLKQKYGVSPTDPMLAVTGPLGSI